MQRRVLIIGPCPPPYGGWAHVVSSVLRPPFSLEYELISYNTKLHESVKHHRNLNIFKQVLVQINSFEQAALNAQADVAILFSGSGGSFWRDLLLLRACHKLGLPVVLRFFGGAITSIIKTMSKPFRSYVCCELSKASAILVETEEMVNDLQVLCPSVPAYRVPNFVHAEDLPQASQEVPCDAKVNVIYMGSLTPSKGVEIILQSIDEVCAKENVAFHFVGGEIKSGYLKSFQSLVDGLNYAQSVYIYGQLSRTEAHKLVSQCQLFIFPSLWPGEGQPAALIEAMGMGLVPVASKWRGIPEIVQNKKNGILLENLSPNSLAQAITELVRNPKWRNDLAANAQNTVLEQYEASKTLKLYQEILEKVISWGEIRKKADQI